MSPQCTADESQQEFDFGKHFQRQVTARFDGGRISSDGGAVLLGEVDSHRRVAVAHVRRGARLRAQIEKAMKTAARASSSPAPDASQGGESRLAYDYFRFVR